jgi:predicted kinase
MAVITVYGMTASGKSFYAENEYLKKADRCIVLDKMHCFKGGDKVTVSSKNDILKLFKKYKINRIIKLL